MGKIKDITGQRFGRLVVLRVTGERLRRGVLWRCACDCGNTCKVSSGDLKSGNVKSCGCLAREYRAEWARSQKKDLTGRRFGQLVVLRDSGERPYGSVLWRCACDCGNTCKVSSASLKSGSTKSCGCLARQTTYRMVRSNIKDITGQRFGRLVVLRDTGERSGRSVLWFCACDCGNTTKVQTGDLKTGRTRSCGCLARETRIQAGRSNLKDITGQRFGRLVVLRDTGERMHGRVLWLCACDCGNTCKVQTGNLQSGHTRSCGCGRSHSGNSGGNQPFRK
jgi:hypothetical protein